MNVKIFGKNVLNIMHFFVVFQFNIQQRSKNKLLTRGSSYRYHGRTQKEVIEYAREHYSKKSNIYSVKQKKSDNLCLFIFLFYKDYLFYLIIHRSYSNTRTVAPVTGRSLRSPSTILKTSDTMRSQHINISSADTTRHQNRPSGISTSNQALTSTTTRGTTTADVTSTDVYQQVYHDDSSTHGSRTLDSRFSRDKDDLSDERSTDNEDEEDEREEQTEKPINGSPSSSLPTTTTIIRQDNNNDDENKPKTDIESVSINNQRVIELDELDKGKSPGIEDLSCKVINDNINNENESNHKKENRISLEIYHNKKDENNENELVKRYSASLKMYLNARHSSGGSHSICITSNIHEKNKYNNVNEDDEEQENLLLKRSHSLELERTLSIDMTHSPSTSSSSSNLEPPIIERLIGTTNFDNNNNENSLLKNSTPPMVIEIRSKPHSLPRMTNYIEYIDRRTLPSINSLSWQDDTIGNDQNIILYKKESSEDSIELVRQVIEFIITQIVEEERKLYTTVDRLVEQACSRALSLYLIERRAQIFSGSSHLLHHKSCMLRTEETDKNFDDNNHTNSSDNNNNNSSVSRFRTKSSPVIPITTDWTDVSRKLAAQTCFAAYPSGNNLHKLNCSEFSTFSDAKLKFFNIITNNDIMPSQSSISLPTNMPLSTSIPNVNSSSSSTRSSRASSVSSYASSMHVPCPPVFDNNSKRYQRPLSARLLDLSDDSDSNPTTSISTSLKTCIIPTTISNSQVQTSTSIPPPPIRTQRRQQKRRSSENLNSSSDDDSLSNQLNKAAGFRSVFIQRNQHNK